MILYFVSFVFFYVYDKVQNKIYLYIFNRSIKLLKWHPAWHREDRKYLDMIADYIFV